MFELVGKYGNAKIFIDNVEQSVLSQVFSILNHPISKDAHVRIMPDCHVGVGCVIGFTAKLTDIVIPNLIGVDIGCGVLACNLGKFNVDDIFFEYLDKKIKELIPSGCNVRCINNKLNVSISEDFLKDVQKVCKLTGQDYDYVYNSLGTLGGGNHFIELNRSKKTGDIWLTIHSGSRNFGLKIAKHFQNLAYKRRGYFGVEIENLKKKYEGKELGEKIKQIKKYNISKELFFLKGDDVRDYYYCMSVAQEYAKLNRNIMAQIIIWNIIETVKYSNINQVVESIHNYIDFGDGIIRKGAIKAHKGQKVVIPFNMAYGIVIGKGKGNPDWNYSAPHGAGRVLARGRAKETLSMNEYKEKMNAVWSSCVNEKTLDESPMAYKSPKEVIRYLKETVDIIEYCPTIYNYKGE